MSCDRDDPTSAEMRHDWLADRWVIIAPQRTERPDDFVKRPPEIVSSDTCPFCLGREGETPSTIATYTPKHNGKVPNWHVRVIPNKFPAVRTTNADPRGPAGEISDSDSDCSEINRIDLFQRRGLYGGHEVIVESPAHVQSLSELGREDVGLVFRAYRDRLYHWLVEKGVSYAVIFKNVGQEAGASLAHTHSQLIATDTTPTDVCRATERMRLFLQKESTCLFCRMVEDECRQDERIVDHTPDFVAFCPFASRLPSMVTVVPKTHKSQFELSSDFELEQLSWLTHRLVRRIEHCYPDTAYNFIIHTATDRMRGSDSFHWRLELFPRLTKVAGFEWGSDCYINPIPPEVAAQNLRRASL